MSETVITSRDNERARHARAVRAGKVSEEIFIEGLRLCEEAARAGGLRVLDVIHTEEAVKDERGATLLSELAQRAARIAIVNEKVFASLSDTKTPQGMLIIAARPQADSTTLEKASAEVPLLVIIHGLGNPANAGAITRTAEAAGATGIIATRGTTDIFSPRALRGAMGSTFRLPVWSGADYAEALRWCRERGIKTVCADIRAGRTFRDVDWTRPRALIVGTEANGLSADEIALADEALRIPMRPPVESLNAAVATAVILYEAARQRS